MTSGGISPYVANRHLFRNRLVSPIAFPSPWKPDSDKSSENVKEVCVVAVVIDSMRWCCSAFFFSLICLGSNSASTCRYIPWVFMKAFCSKKDSGSCCRSFISCKSLFALVAHQRQLFRENCSQRTTADASQGTGKEGIACTLYEHEPSTWNAIAEKLHITSEEVTIKSSEDCTA